MEVTNTKKHFKTNIKKNTKNPTWNETFTLDVTDTLREKLICTVDDHDTLVDDKIGVVEIPIIDVVASKNSMLKYKEFKVIGSKTGCKLYLDLEYFEEAKIQKKKQ